MSEKKHMQINEFELHAGEGRAGITTEFWRFLKHNKKWWLLPLVILSLVFGALVLLAGTAAGPFIYSLF